MLLSKSPSARACKGDPFSSLLLLPSGRAGSDLCRVPREEDPSALPPLTARALLVARRAQRCSPHPRALGAVSKGSVRCTGTLPDRPTACTQVTRLPARKARLLSTVWKIAASRNQPPSTRNAFRTDGGGRMPRPRPAARGGALLPAGRSKEHALLSPPEPGAHTSLNSFSSQR